LDSTIPSTPTTSTTPLPPGPNRTVPAPPPPTYPDPIPGVIPFGTVTLVAGAPGVGKTAMLSEWIVRWRDGRQIWGHPTNQPTGFYYLAADRQWQSHQTWFNTVGFPDIPRYSLADDPSLNLDWVRQPSNAIKLFERCLDHLKPLPGGHVFVDPIAPLFIVGDQNRPRDVAITLFHFSRFAKRYQINITAAAHFSKQKMDAQTQYRRPMDRISGTGAFVGYSDTQVWLIDPEPPEQPYHIFGWRPRHSKEENFKVTRTDTCLFIPYTEDGEETRLLLELIPYDRSISTGELADLVFEAMGMNKRTLYRRLIDLREAGLVEHIRGRVIRKKLH